MENGFELEMYANDKRNGFERFIRNIAERQAAVPGSRPGWTGMLYSAVTRRKRNASPMNIPSAPVDTCCRIGCSTNG